MVMDKNIHDWFDLQGGLQIRGNGNIKTLSNSSLVKL